MCHFRACVFEHKIMATDRHVHANRDNDDDVDHFNHMLGSHVAKES